MRVIAGTARGRRLQAPAGRDTRPTSDRVKEALFASLAPLLDGARVLDCYAGSGALGIEACSRGAAHAVLVEQDRRALVALRSNLDRAGLGGCATVVAGDVARFCRAPAGGPFDLVLADPPYATPLATVWAHLGDLHAAHGLADGATVVVERDRRDPDLIDAMTAAPTPALECVRERTYGDTVLLYLASPRARPERPAPP